MPADVGRTIAPNEGTRNIRVTTRGRKRKKALAQLLAEISEAKKEACHLKIASADGFSMPTALL